MSEEQKTPVVNTEAEKDVQNVLAELKEGGASEQTAEEAEEARIVAAAAKIGEQSVKAEGTSTGAQTEKRETRSFQRDGRPRPNNAKFDPSNQEVTDDPADIRKQV
jgi:lupus La protein